MVDATNYWKEERIKAHGHLLYRAHCIIESICDKSKLGVVADLARTTVDAICVKG